MVLMILPALIDDQELTYQYLKLHIPRNGKITIQDYEKYYEKKYKQAVASLKKAIGQMPPELPENMVYYVHYQRWRILNNWANKIVALQGKKKSDKQPQQLADLDMMNTALKQAKAPPDGVDILEEIRNEMLAVPATNPLGKIMHSLTLPPLPTDQTLPQPGEPKP